MSNPYAFFFFFQAEDGIRDHCVTGVQTCALPISRPDDTLGLQSSARWEWHGRLVVEPDSALTLVRMARSEERRVGKECRSRGWRDHEKKRGRRECRRGRIAAEWEGMARYGETHTE